MDRISKNQAYIGIADVIRKRSTCLKRQVGCVITDGEGEILSIGYNGAPRGFEHCTSETCARKDCSSGEHLERCVAVHAEQNAIIQCSRMKSAEKIYVTSFPCNSCLKLLCNTRIRKIYYLESYADTDESFTLWLKMGREIECLKPLEENIQADKTKTTFETERKEENGN